MSSELTGVVASVRLLWDVVKANKTFANYNELVAAVSEVNADLIAAQAVAITSQKSELALTELVRELKEKIVALENWDREAERYVLTEIASEVFAHCLKPGMEKGEPPHKLCTHCYKDHKKEVLQSDNSDGAMPQTTYTCPGCGGRITVRHSRGSGVEMVPLRRARDKWQDY